MDRAQNNDTTNAAPVAGNIPTMFPAENNAYCPPVTLNALSFDWATLNAKVDQMTPNGSTNQTIGLAWGWQALTSTNPLNAPVQDPTVQNVIVLLSDGDANSTKMTGSSDPQGINECQAAITAAEAAETAGTLVFSVAYGALTHYGRLVERGIVARTHRPARFGRALRHLLGA